MADALTGIRSRAKTTTPTRTNQMVKAHRDEIRNDAGGYVFGISDEARLHRFLTMGTDGGTYYLSEAELTRQNADVVFRAAASAPMMLVRAIREVSLAGRAPRQNPAIFALAVAASHADDEGRKAALAALPDVCRTGTHLFLFLTYVEQFRGWGRGLRRAIGRWYDEKPIDKLAYQVVKYRQREGWTHSDALKLASDRGPTGGTNYTATFDADHALLYNYVAGRGVADKAGEQLPGTLPDIVLAYEALKRSETKDEVLRLLDTDGVSWEMIPDKFRSDPAVWEKLVFKGMPIGALIRQLPTLTRIGLGPATLSKVVADLTDVEKLKKGRIHPVNVLVAQKTYASGRSERGSSTWSPLRQIADALDAAFYASFGAVTPAGKSTLVGIDCSGSMGPGWSGGTRTSGAPLTCIEACAAVGMVTAATEPAAEFVGFDTSAWRLDGISARRRLDDNVAYLKSQIRGGTDTSLPVRYALANRVFADTIIILTDAQTWAGRQGHPWQVMEEYRRQVNPNARLVTVAMTATGHSQSAPFDAQALDVSGFDSAVPQIIADFSAGRI